jgi:hypothetical protein
MVSAIRQLRLPPPPLSELTCSRQDPYSDYHQAGDGGSLVLRPDSFFPPAHKPSPPARRPHHLSPHLLPLLSSLGLGQRDQEKERPRRPTQPPFAAPSPLQRLRADACPSRSRPLDGRPGRPRTFVRRWPRFSLHGLAVRRAIRPI